MFTIQANSQQEVIIDVNYVTNFGQSMSVVNLGSYFAGLIDKANKYVFLFASLSVAPYFQCIRYEYADGILSNPTPMTLSGFGTFTSSPQFWAYQGSKSGDYHIYFPTNGGSASITALSTYPITISGTTITLGTMNTLPVIAGKTLTKLFAKGQNLYAFYYATTGNIVDTGRKWNGSSWATLSGSALPTSVVPGVQSNQALSGSQSSSLGSQPKILGGTSGNIAQCLFNYSTSYSYQKFNTDTDTWAIAEFSGTTASLHTDVDGIMFGPGAMVLADGTILPFFNNVVLYYGISDISNGILFANAQFGTSGYFKGNGKRIRRIAGTAGDAGMLFSVDGGANRKVLKYATTLISDNYNLNYIGDLCVFVISSSFPTVNLNVEIVS